MLRTLIVSSLVVVTAVNSAWALSCASPDTEYAYQQHQYVFTGMVQSIRDIGELPGQDDDLRNTYVMAAVKIENTYKGRLLGTVKVFANSYWGMPFEAGTRFLIYANMEGGRLITPLCSGTMNLEFAQDQIEILESIDR